MLGEKGGLMQTKVFLGGEGEHNRIILIQISSIVLMCFFCFAKNLPMATTFEKIYKSIIFLIE